MSGRVSSAAPPPSPDDPGALETVVRGLRLNPELRVGLGVTMLLALLATAGRVVVPVAIQQVVDRGLAQGGVDLDAVTFAVLAAVVAVGVTATTTSVMNRRLATVVETALSNLRVRTFAHVHDLSMLHQATQQRGQLVSRVTSDIDEISRFMSWGGLNLVSSSGQLVVATLVMLAYSWRLTLVVLITFVPFVLAARWFQRRLTVAYTAVRRRVGDLLGVVAETVVGADVVRAYGVEERTQERLDERIEAHRSAAVHAGTLSSTFSGTGELFGAVATAAVVATGVLGGAGDVSAGTVVAFLFLVSLFVDPVNIAMEVVNEGQTAVAGWRRVLDVLDTEPDVADPGEDGARLPAGPVDVEFRHVNFRYPRFEEHASQASGPLVLRDVQVRIEAQSRVAVVGETGSGKTTFAKLLTRLMDPTDGEVLLGGEVLRELSFASMRRRVVMVPQEGSLFAGSIRDNVEMGLPPGTDRVDADRAIRSSFDELGLGDWVDEQPDGLASMVGERGAGLSAGEKQLVALARAHVAQPDLLVLDEATSAVDPATEVRLQRALTGLAVGRTVVTIAHRLSTAEQADAVLVFDAGVLVQHGPHDELVEQDGVYGRLHASWVSGQVAAP